MGTHEITPTTKEQTPLYVEDTDMFKGLKDEEVEQYLEDNLLGVDKAACAEEIIQQSV